MVTKALDNSTKRPRNRNTAITAYLAILLVVLLGLTQFGLFGKIIYAIYAVLVVLVAVVAPSLWLLKKKPAKWRTILPIALPLLAAPPVEEFWIAHRFETLCKDAGVHVYKRVEVDGYYDDTGVGPAEPGPIESPQAVEALERTGFRYKEYRAYRQKVGTPKQIVINHMEKDPNGNWQTTVLGHPKARYHYKKPLEDDWIGWKLTVSEYVVVDSLTDEKLGNRRFYKRYPSVVEALWIRWLGTGMRMCPDPEAGPRQPSFPNAVFIHENNTYSKGD